MAKPEYPITRIEAYLDEISRGGGGAGSWEDIPDKPFERIGEGLKVEDGTLMATGQEVTYIYTQGSSSSEWTITHNLGKYPSVTVVDSAGTQIVGDVHYHDGDTLTVIFSAPFAGKAYLN